jgi:porin
MCSVLSRATLVAAAVALCAPALPACADDKPVAERIADTRAALEDAGYQFSLTYIGEAFANVSGGVSNGAVYTGRLDLGTTIDLEKVMGWSGATFHANMYQIHGDGLSRSYVGNLLLVSGVESLSGTRLYEFWIEQKLLDGKLAVRVGQQGSDVEFIDSQYDDIFINSALGWPGITGANLPAGGPSPPLAVPGIRIKANLSDRITAYLALFDGSAAAQGTECPRARLPHQRSAVVDRPTQVQIRDRREQAAGDHHRRRLVSHGLVRRSAYRGRRAVAGRSQQLRRHALAAARQRHLHGL